ncbi:MAG: DUF4160 domain-containing protein [Rickettsiales bacterium]
MPTICFFYGIYISMYVNEHNPPHFHAEYQGNEALINIQNGELLDGKLPRQALNLIDQWRKQHIAELMENWDNATKLIMPKKIAPLE